MNRPALFLALLGMGLLLLLSGCSDESSGSWLRIAVAANFIEPAQVLAERFEAETGLRVIPISGSTGKLYAQIAHGAPYDILMAADVERPQRLEESGLGIVGSRFTYALGGLVLWSPNSNAEIETGVALETGEFRHLAIANPELAPYGRAARESLQKMGIWEQIEPKLVLGENIAQTFQFVSSGAAEAGLIARSQLPETGSHWAVPQEFHSPIAQQAIIISSTSKRDLAERFIEFLRGESARALIESFGYRTPEN